MSVLENKLSYNGLDLLYLKWNAKNGFLTSEIAKVLSLSNKDDLSNFLRLNMSVVKGTDFDALQENESKELIDLLHKEGIKKRFVKALIVYPSGLLKYFDHRVNQDTRNLETFLIKSGVIPQGKAASKSPAALEVQASIKTVSKEQKTAEKSDDYSKVIESLKFAEDFVNVFNSIRIAPEDYSRFTISMLTFLKEHKLEPDILTKELKKWSSK